MISLPSSPVTLISPVYLPLSGIATVNLCVPLSLAGNRLALFHWRLPERNVNATSRVFAVLPLLKSSSPSIVVPGKRLGKSVTRRLRSESVNFMMPSRSTVRIFPSGERFQELSACGLKPLRTALKRHSSPGLISGRPLDARSISSSPVHILSLYPAL